MEQINGEWVATNPKSGAQVVFRNGAWVPFGNTTQQPSAYQRFARPVTKGLENLFTGGPVGVLNAGRPVPTMPDLPGGNQALAHAAASYFPQTPTQAGKDIGMVVGSLLAPEVTGAGVAAKLARPAIRIASTALGGAGGAAAGGESPLGGAESGAIQQGVGEATAPAINLLGRYGK